MESTTKKILVAALLIFIGLPIVLLLAANAAFWMTDKTNGTIVSSGVIRRFILYVPQSYDRSKATPLVIFLCHYSERMYTYRQDAVQKGDPYV